MSNPDLLSPKPKSFYQKSGMRKSSENEDVEKIMYKSQGMTEQEGLSKARTVDSDSESMTIGEDGHPIDEYIEKGKGIQPRLSILQKVLSTPRALAIINQDPGPPPDGGTQAWLQVVAAHLCIFNSAGYVSSYGLFEAFYLSDEGQKMMHSEGLTSSTWTWPGSMQLFFLLFTSTLSGRLYDAGYFRPLLLFGFTLQLLGIFTTSIAHSYSQILLAQGVAQGIGNGFMLCPSVSNLSTYFVRKRSLAITLMASGSATGGVIFPVIAQQLLPKVGFAWTVRVMGFVVLFNQIVIINLARARMPPRKSGPWVEWKAFGEAPYVLFVCGMFFIYLGLYFAFSYINLYAKNVIGVSTSTSLTILLVFSAVGFPGRVIPALLADKIGPINTMIPVTIILAVLFFLWITVSTLPTLFVFAIVFGLFDAAAQGVGMASLTSLTKDLSKIGTRVGMALTVLAFAALGGTPIAGVLLDVNRGSFLWTQVFGGIVTLVGAGFLVSARVASEGWYLRKRL